jgi:hypothetical protein
MREHGSAPRIDQLVFGGIAPDLQPAVEEVFSDYAAASRESGLKPLSELGEIELERKIAKEIAALVGERQALEFMAYNSKTAKYLQSAFQGVQGLDDVAYLKVFEAYSTFKSHAGLELLTQSPRGGMSEAYRIAELEAISKAATPQVTLQFVSRQHTEISRKCRRSTRRPGVSPEDTMVDRYRGLSFDPQGAGRTEFAATRPEPERLRGHACKRGPSGVFNSFRRFVRSASRGLRVQQNRPRTLVHGVAKMTKSTCPFPFAFLPRTLQACPMLAASHRPPAAYG